MTRWFDPALQQVVIGSANTTLDGSETTLISQGGSVREMNILDLGGVLNIKSPTYGAKGDGVHDDTAAFAAAALVGGRIYIPKGTFLISDTVLFALQRTNVFGDGQQSTIIKFAPTTTGKACFHFKQAAAATIAQCSLRGVAFDATGNTQGTKSAVRVTDGEEIILDDIAVSNWSSAGKDCIGFQFRGRQTHSISRYTLNCDNPVSIEDDPNTTIDIDHFHFWDGYVIADPSQPCYKVASGVNLTNVTIDGYQAWVNGSDGFKFIDTTTSQVGQQLTIKNVRWEQSTNATGHMIDIEHNTNLQGVRIENCFGGLNTLGIKLRKCPQTTLDSVAYIGSGSALDVDSSYPLQISNCSWQAGSSASIANAREVYRSPFNPNTGGLAYTVIYDSSSNADRQVESEMWHEGISVSVAQDAESTAIAPAGFVGFAIINTDESVQAIYAFNGTFGASNEVSDPNGFFTNTKGTVSSYNIYATGGAGTAYVVQNKRTGTHKFRCYLIGATAF